jgi:hypothetical protein
MAKLHLKLVAPSKKTSSYPDKASKCRAPDARAPDRDRDREAAQSSRNEPLGPPGRHDDLGGLPPRGLRAKLVDLRSDQINFTTATLHVRRVKQGTPATHPILGDELRALRRLQREQEPKSAFVFTSERSSPFSTAGCARMVERAGLPPLSEPSPRNNAPAARAANRPATGNEKPGTTGRADCKKTA